MDKLTAMRPGRNPFDTWNSGVRVELGPARSLDNDGMERDVYVDGVKVGQVERVMKQSSRNFRVNVVDGWRKKASFPGRVAEASNKIGMLYDTQTWAVAKLVNTYIQEGPEA